MLNTRLKFLICVFVLLIIVSCKDKNSNVYQKSDLLGLLKKVETLTTSESKKEKYLDELSLKLQSEKNDSLTRSLHFKIAYHYYNLNLLDKYLSKSKNIYQLAVEVKDKKHIAKALYYLGDYYDYNAQLDSAFYFYSKSQNVYKSINDTLNTGRTTLYKAGILYDSGNFTESEIETITALTFLSKTKNTRLKFECYNLLALSLEGLNNYEKALDYYELALKQLEKLDDEDNPKTEIVKSRASINNNKGGVYAKMQKYRKAIIFYKKGLLTKKLEQDSPKLYAMLLNNLAYSEMKSGRDNGVKFKFFESLKIRESLNADDGILSSKFSIGEYFLYQKDTAMALIYFKEGYALSKKIKSNYDIIHSLKLLTENDSKNKNFYSNLYFKVNDSIQNLERQTRNKFARIAYETDQIEDENQLLVKRYIYILIISFVLVVFSGAFLLIYRLKSRNKELLFLKDQQEANEKIYQLMLKQQSETEKARAEERNRIAMELHDGIVNSIFTTRFNLIQLESGAFNKKEQLVKELEKTENEIRRVSHDLTQNLLFEDKSLSDIITNLVESQHNHFNTKFDLSIDKYIDWSLVLNDNKIHIYRIIQEAIQNINKYSKAERCYVMLLKTADKITIRIWDNGIGFNHEKVKQGIGLKNINERTKALNGALKITSSIGNGTTIEIVF